MEEEKEAAGEDDDEADDGEAAEEEQEEQGPRHPNPEAKYTDTPMDAFLGAAGGQPQSGAVVVDLLDSGGESAAAAPTGAEGLDTLSDHVKVPLDMPVEAPPPRVQEEGGGTGRRRWRSKRAKAKPLGRRKEAEEDRKRLRRKEAGRREGEWPSAPRQALPQGTRGKKNYTIYAGILGNDARVEVQLTNRVFRCKTTHVLDATQARDPKTRNISWNKNGIDAAWEEAKKVVNWDDAVAAQEQAECGDEEYRRAS